MARSLTVILGELVFLACVAAAQEPYEYPRSPLSPTSERDCSLLTERYQNDLDSITATHQRCLDAHPHPDNPNLPPTSSRCSVNACQSLHDKMFEVRAAGAAVNRERAACVARVDQTRQQRERDLERQRSEHEARQRQLEQAREERQRQHDEWQRQHDAQVRAAQNRVQTIIDNNNRAQKALSDAFEQIRARLEQEREERRAREEVERLEDEERQRQEEERQEEESLRKEEESMRESSAREQNSTPGAEPLLPADENESVAEPKVARFDNLASLFSSHSSKTPYFGDPEPEPAKPINLAEVETFSAGLFDQTSRGQPLAVVKLSVNQWLNDLQKKLADNNASYFLTGKNFDEQPVEFRRRYAMWKATLDRTFKPTSVKAGLKQVEAFRQLFELWSETE